MITENIMHLCTGVIVGHGGLFVTLFVAGLVGSAAHCVGMCGPFVLNQTATLLDAHDLGALPPFARLRGAALLPYHAGRMTTYGFLGVMASLLSARLHDYPWFGAVSAGLLVAAGVIFILNALPHFLPRFSVGPTLPSWAAHYLKFLFTHPQGLRGYLLGLALGFLPCGLVYGAIISAAAYGQPLTAAFGMIGFALGTVPALVAVGLAGQMFWHRHRKVRAYALPVLMIVNSLALFMMAGEWIK